MTDQDKMIKQLRADKQSYKMKFICERELVELKNRQLFEIKNASVWTRIKWVFTGVQFKR